MIRILIAYDGSSDVDLMIEGLHQAGLPNRALIQLITVADPRHDVPEKRPEPEIAWLSHRLVHARSAACRAANLLQYHFPAWRIDYDASLASPMQEIMQRLELFTPDLLLLGPHRAAEKGMAGLGRIAKRLLKTAPCNVRIGRARRNREAIPGNPARILIAVQDIGRRHRSEKAVQHVLSRCWPSNSEVMLVNAIGPILSELQLVGSAYELRVGLARDQLRRQQRRLSAAGLSVTTEVSTGFPTVDILDIADQWNAGSIFIEAEETGFFRRLFSGDWVAGIAAQAACSVEIVRKGSWSRPAIQGITADEEVAHSLRIAS